MQERGLVATVAALTRRHAIALGAVASAVIAADQLTKTWAEHALADGPIHLFWTFQLGLTYNSGAAFGSGRGLTPLITVLAVVVLCALVGVSRSVTSRLGQVAVGLVIGGASSNLIDRFARGHSGAVIDWIDPRWWPVFNVADACIVIGAGLLLLSSRTPREDRRT